MLRTFEVTVIFENYGNLIRTEKANSEEEAIKNALNKLDERHFHDSEKATAKEVE